MTATVQLFPGGSVRAFRTIENKTVPVADPWLPKDETLAIGRRAPGLPRAAYTIADKTGGVVIGDPKDSTLAVWRRPPGLMRAAYTISDKTISTTAYKVTTDTYVLYGSLGNLTAVELYTTSTLRPLGAFAGHADVAVAASDTYRPRGTQTTVSISSSGATYVAAADTYVPIGTFATVSVSQELIATTDTYTPVLTFDSGTGPEKVDLVTASDTYTPVLREGWRVVVHSYHNKYATDTYRPVGTQATSRLTKRTADVDVIRVRSDPTMVIRVRQV